MTYLESLQAELRDHESLPLAHQDVRLLRRLRDAIASEVKIASTGL